MFRRDIRPFRPVFYNPPSSPRQIPVYKALSLPPQNGEYEVFGGLGASIIVLDEDGTESVECIGNALNGFWPGGQNQLSDLIPNKKELVQVGIVVVIEVDVWQAEE